MFSYIIGCLIGLAMFICLRYCLDTPSPCGDGPDFDSLPGYSARPDVIIPSEVASASYSSHSFQEKLYAVFRTYIDYDRLRREYSEILSIDRGQSSNSLIYNGLSLLFIGAFSVYAFPWNVPVIKWIVSIALPVAFYFAAGRIYKVSSFTFKYRSVATNALRKDFDDCAAQGFPITYEELKGLQFEPYSPKAPFDPFIYHVLNERIIFMESVLDSLRFRRKVLHALDILFFIGLVLVSQLRL
ncbi:MAG: hypothetical protein ACLUF9_01235 [Oscillospiraceae bacterium]